MSKSIMLLVFMSLILTSLFADSVVTTTGYGLTEREAVNKALKLAVEQGAGVKIFSETIVDRMTVLNDYLVSETCGFVTSYKILETGKQDQRNWVKIEAQISKEIEKKWASMKILLEQKGRPRIMFNLKESIDGQVLSHPVAEPVLCGQFSKIGFDVIDRFLSKDAKNQAEILITGEIAGKLSRKENFYGAFDLVTYSYNFTASVVRTDNAQNIGSTSKVYTYSFKSIDNREIEARKGLIKIVEQDAFNKLTNEIVDAWIRQLNSGYSFTIVISNVEFRDRNKILNELKKYPDVLQSIQVRSYRDKKIELDVRSQISNDEVATRLENIKELEVTEVKRGYLELQYNTPK